jgi:hypothetical protein
MDSIDRDTLDQAGELIATLDHAKTGNIKTVTLAVDDRTGDCQVKVESERAGDILLLVLDSTKVE